jgi:3-oxoacyl-[acyl-carrier protein] reductase
MPSVAGNLLGKVAVVTGASKGIGAGIARVFAEAGAKVVVAGRDVSSGTLCANGICEAGGEAAFVRVDVTQKADVDRMAATARERYGRIDILCCNAGIYPVSPLLEMTEADWDHVLAVNLKGPFLAIKACLPYMISQCGGRILITSSVTGNKTAIPGLTHYAASKGGINGLIRSAALELAPYGITVNGVEPGMVLSEGMVATFGDDADALFAAEEQRVPLRRIGTPEDIGHAMLYLASDEAGYVTGQTIVVDGGAGLPEG